MRVTCEQCGKKYRLDKSQIQGTEMVCTKCHNRIRLNDLDAELEDLSQTISRSPLNFTKKRGRKNASTAGKPSLRRLGLRSKILLLFFLVPIVLIVAAGYLFLGQLKNLSGIINDESTVVVTDIAEQIISEKAHAVARQVQVYLETHPNLKKEDLAKDPEFMKVAVQKVGETGYTVLNNGPEGDQPWRIIVHPVSKLIGADILNAVKARLSKEDYLVFKKLHDDAHRTQTESTGYYRFLDDKEKYQSMVPVEGTNYWALATTYIDEFTQPIYGLQKQADGITRSTQRIVTIIIAITTILVALIAVVYGNMLSSKIKRLKDIADSISVGDMDIEIDIADKDEIGDLAQAISRMQDSIRLSIERLRRRRDRQAA